MTGNGRLCTARVVAGIALLLAASPALPQAGRVAESTAGEVGQRQTRGQPVAGVEPLARIRSRIENRVQSRIRTRIDRSYNPQADAAASVEAASDQVRRPVRR